VSRPSVKACDENLRRAEPVGLGLAQDSIEVLQHAVHPGIARDAHQVQLGAGARLDAANQRAPHRVAGRLPLEEELVEPHQLLIDDPTRPDVFVADLAVAHDAVGQSDIETGCLDQRRRILRMQPVITGLLRQKDGVGRVLGRIGILAPAIADDQEDGLAR
jgi:hypothetical protein